MDDDRVWTGIIVLVFLGIALYGCDRKTWTEDEIREIAQRSAPYEGGNTQLTMDHDAKLKELEAKIDSLQKQIDGVRALGLENSDNAQSLANTINKNILIDATNEGRCGRGWVKHKDGTQVFENIPCNAEYLWPGRKK